MTLARILAITTKSLQQFSHDPRTIAFVIAMPLLMILAFAYGFGGQPTHIHVVVANEDTGPAPALVLGNLPAGVLDVSMVADAASAQSTVHAGSAWAGIVFAPGFTNALRSGNASLTVYLDGSSPTIAGAVLSALRAAVATLAGQAGVQVPFAVNADYVYGSSSTPFVDTLAPGIMAIASLMVATVLSIIVVVRERAGGLLERLFASPLRASEFVVGNALSLTVLALGQSTVLFATTIVVFQARFVGNIALAFGFLLLFAVGNLGLGMLLSAAARSEFQAIQFIPLLLFPSLLFTGALFPLETIPVAIRPISAVFPLTYCADALHSVLLRGWGASDVAWDALALTIYATITLLAAVALLRRRR